MVPNRRISPRRDFLSVAVELSMLTEQAARGVELESADHGLAASKVVLQRGLLNPVQVDIVETLLSPDQVIPGFEILELVGQGGMGVVYRARQQSLDRTVALKTVLINQMANTSVLARFEQEAVTVGRLRHPNIVAAYDFGKHGGRLYLSMEFVEGEDAEQLVARKGRLDEATTWGIVKQAAAGLSHAAQEGIVHRDIKPANLLLVPPPEGFSLPDGLPMVKIADFGLALLTTELDSRTRLTAENAAVGTPHYMAPEQLRSDSFDSRVDIYALGATAYHLLCGRPPFDRRNLARIIASKRADDVDPLRSICPVVSKPTAALVSSMMARDPNSRIADYSELISRIDSLRLPPPAAGSGASSALSDALEPTTIVARHATSTRDLAKPVTETIRPHVRRIVSRVSRRAAAISGLLLIGIPALIVFFAWRFSRDDASTNVEIGPRDMIQGGIESALFDGRSLSGGWLPNTGRWNVEDGPHGSKVLAGQGGIMYRRFAPIGRDGGDELSNYRLSFLVWLNRAAAVELNFAIEDGPARDAPRCVLRLTPEDMQLGFRSGRFQPLQPLTDAMPLPEGKRDDSFLVTLERQRKGWWVLVDDKVVGALPDRAPKFKPLFGLSVERGPAWFSDFFLMELIEPAPNG